MFRGYPKGLYPLCFTELWERFGFYAVQAILVLYMSRGMGLSDNQAYLLYGTFSSMLYLTPVIGGYLADRFLGYRRSVMIGGVLFVIGYLVMAIRSQQSLFLGMSIVIIACGLFKPNVSSMVGSLYSPHDHKRDSGFTIFYMGINIGSLLPPLFVGPLADRYGWHSVFFVAAIGLVIGLVTFFKFRKQFEGGALPVKRPVIVYSLLSLGSLAAIGVLHVLFIFPQETVFVLVGTSIAFFTLIFLRLFKEMPESRRKLIACLILILISVGFWSVYVQTYTSMMLFAERNMGKRFLGLTIDPEFTQFFNPFFIILLSPILSSYWFWLGSRKQDPSTPAKFTYGLLMMAIGFLFLGVAVRWFSVDGLVSPWWLVISYFFQTIGELLISPIGLAMVTKLAPPHLRGTLMGVWFLMISAAFAMGGGLATWASVPSGATIEQSLLIYSKAFLEFGTIALVIAIISLACIPYVKRLIEPPEDIVKTPK